MSGKRITLLGLAQAMGTVLYVVLVVLLMIGLMRVIGSADSDGEVVGAVGMLLLFIISACVTGAMVLGYPAVLALEQRIRDAVLLVVATVAWLVLLLAAIVGIIASGLANAS